METWTLWCSGQHSSLFTASVVGMMGCHSPIQSCAFLIGQALLQRYDNFFYYNTVIYYSFLQIGHFTLDNAANNKTIGAFKVATYFIIIFYLMGFYCQITISDLIGVFKVTIYSYLLVYLL